jgi:tellurite resistance protein TerC
MLAVDLLAHRRAHVIAVREAAAWSCCGSPSASRSASGLVGCTAPSSGQQYFAGYLIEKSLAVDNVFVWAIIFTYFAVPREYQHRVLFLGVLGALVFRGAFIAGGSVLIDELQLGALPFRRVPALHRLPDGAPAQRAPGPRGLACPAAVPALRCR